MEWTPGTVKPPTSTARQDPVRTNELLDPRELFVAQLHRRVVVEALQLRQALVQVPLTTNGEGARDG